MRGGEFRCSRCLVLRVSPPQSPRSTQSFGGRARAVTGGVNDHAAVGPCCAFWIVEPDRPSDTLSKIRAQRSPDDPRPDSQQVGGRVCVGGRILAYWAPRSETRTRGHGAPRCAPQVADAITEDSGTGCAAAERPRLGWQIRGGGPPRGPRGRPPTAPVESRPRHQSRRHIAHDTASEWRHLRRAGRHLFVHRPPTSATPLHEWFHVKPVKACG
jgi:hypothetical protein